MIELSNQKLWSGDMNEIQDPTLRCLQNTSALRTHIALKWRDGNIFHGTGNQKKVAVAILTSDK